MARLRPTEPRESRAEPRAQGECRHLFGEMHTCDLVPTIGGNFLLRRAKGALLGVPEWLDGGWEVLEVYLGGWLIGLLMFVGFMMFLHFFDVHCCGDLGELGGHHWRERA